MKKMFLLLLVIISLDTNAQKLKDLLYSGKLKSDSGTVVHKDDDLSKKIDTNTKKPVDSFSKKTALIKDSSVNLSVAKEEEPAKQVSAGETAVPAPAPRDNTVVWKEYMDSMITTLTTEVLPDKKIKKGIYYILVDYVIDPDGSVTINNVYPSPENKILQQQVKERLVLTAPHLSPVIGGNGQPRKAIKKYNFSLKKE